MTPSISGAKSSYLASMVQFPPGFNLVVLVFIEDFAGLLKANSAEGNRDEAAHIIELQLVGSVLSRRK